MVWCSYDTSSSTDSTTVWSNWTTAGTASTCSDTGVWLSWNNSCTEATTSTISSDTIWTVWVNGRSYGKSEYYSFSRTRKQTKAEKQAERERLRRQAEERREREAKAKAREEEKKKSEQKAKDLLLDLIGEKELAVYNETGRLFVKGKKFDYIIQKSGYIKRIGKTKITDLCVHLDNRYKFPETDNVVAMKLAIEDDENSILKLANEWGSVDRPKKLLKAACM